MTQEIVCTSQYGNATVAVESVPFSEIPGQSTLFTQYQHDPLSLRRFYPSAVESHAQVSARIPEVLAHHKADRNILCDTLAEMNTKFGGAEKTFENIELLRDSGTVAVVSGQQAGLFSGPLYTIFKALSAIKTADCLRGRGIKAVPVFWVATEDHDFDEVSNAFVLGPQGELNELRNEPKRCYENLPVGYVKLDDSITRTRQELLAGMLPTEFTAELTDLIEASWMSRSYFGDAFARMMTKLLGDRGLIILCPLDKRLKQLASPVYSAAITKSAEIVKALRNRSSELESEGFQAQVHIGEDYFPLFWQARDHTRNALKKSASGTYRTKDGSREFTLEDLAEIAAEEPSRFSPSVVLRSVVQDYLLPTVCYFGGAAEVAYFAQSGEVYRILDRPMTPIIHRQSFTFIESKHAKTMQRYDLGFRDLFAGLEETLPGIVEGYLNKGTAKTFAEVEETINTALNGLDRELSTIDPTLAENLATRRRKIIFQIGAMRHKFHHVQVRKDATIRRQVETMFTAILPHGHLQERTLNISYFLNRYGTGFVDWIYDAIDLDDKGHRLIHL
ncbi:MAG: bacillithiol biosynthesis cysteine-adding enzyme BshC [Pyrinomonadaceae bacterium]